MRGFTKDDCEEIRSPEDMYRKVVVYENRSLRDADQGQLFLCAEKVRAENPRKMVWMISLSNGEKCLRSLDQVLGMLKPECLPDEAKLQLSQIAFYPEEDFDRQTALYSGYCFLEDGRYSSGVWLYSDDEMMDYVRFQMPYQHQIMICDRDDFAILKVCKGKVVYPRGEDQNYLKTGEIQMM